MVDENFAVFILTHGRAENVITAKTLKRQGYTGKWFCVIDNEDEQEQSYRANFGDKVLQFDKMAVAKTFDAMDTQTDRRTIVYARNACFDLADKIGVKYFLELDDDYTSFQYRYEDGGKLRIGEFKNLDSLFCAMIHFLGTTKIDTVAFAQGGDMIGGAKSGLIKELVKRKAMNTFFCDVSRRFQFIGRINEDVNTYTMLGGVGWVGLTVADGMITQKQTQKNGGGMSDVYLDSGTYLKSFYSVMGRPDCVKIGIMGSSHKRIHHNVEWDYCVPKIINEKWRKER